MPSLPYRYLAHFWHLVKVPQLVIGVLKSLMFEDLATLWVVVLYNPNKSGLA